MRFLIGMFLVLALCAGCVSTITRASDGTTTYEQHGMVEIDPVRVSTAGYIDSRANTEDAFGDTLREDPALVFDFLRDMANPWRFMHGGQWGSRRSVGQTNPCYYGGPCGVPMTPVVPVGGVQ